MSRALLLSPDDQAVNAITGVLEEMSVSCERPMDGASAALKLNSNNFELVLVDCENLPAAKLIFDVCRRGQSGNTPVPIAIVDGRAGLPTAFRLGADLILTKPVSKDNARTTIRTALGRVKKDEPAAIATEAEEIANATVAEVQEKTMAATAAFTSAPEIPLPTPKISEPAPEKTAEAAATPLMGLTVKETPSSKILFSSEVAPSRVVRRPLEILPGIKAEPEEKLSDDPVLAEIDKTENEVVQAAPTPALSAAPGKTKKAGGPVVLLALILMGGASYAARMYSPAFSALVASQIDRVLVLAGQKPLTAARTQVKAAVPVPAAPKAATPAAPPAASAASPAANAANPSTSDVPAAPAAPAKSEVATAQTSNTPRPAPPSAETTSASGADSSKVITLEHPPEMEKNIVILSSKGAEKRLDHRVAPVYPKGAKDGSVVMKAVITDTGNVSSVSLVEGDPDLASAAMKAVKQWHYKPYARGGKNLEFQTIVMVEKH